MYNINKYHWVIDIFYVWIMQIELAYKQYKEQNKIERHTIVNRKTIDQVTSQNKYSRILK